MKKPTKSEMHEYSDLRDAEGHLRDAQGYLAFAIKNLQKKDFKSVHHSMARVRECLTEVNLRIRKERA